MKEVLLVSIAFSPNVGGIETHFDDLVAALNKRNWKVWVLTLKPITTAVHAPFYEKQGKLTEIYRISWFGGLFYNLVRKPALEFLYLLPGLFIALPIFLAFKGKEIEMIHSHGLVAGFVSVFWGKIFGKKVITTTHSIYNFPEKGAYRSLAKWVFGSSDKVLTLSRQSEEEMLELGVNKSRVKVFTYWIDLNKFKRIENARQKLGWKYKFVVLFVGRLVPEKGVKELLSAARLWDREITLAIIGTGPLEREVEKAVRTSNNVLYLGKVNNDKLPIYYSASDLVIIPSTHEEGFGRVILESLACGTPVIGSKRGAISEAMDESVGRLIDVTPQNIKEAVEYFYKHPAELKKLSQNARTFVQRRYSERNVEKIIQAYQPDKSYHFNSYSCI